MNKIIFNLTLLNAVMLLSSCASNSRHPGLYVNSTSNITATYENYTAPAGGKIANINFINKTDMNVEYRLISDPKCIGDKVITISNIADLSGKVNWAENVKAGELLTLNIKANEHGFYTKSSCSTTINFVPEQNARYNVKFNVIPVGEKGILRQCHFGLTYIETIDGKDYEKTAVAGLNKYKCDQ